jgi:hypothetical protein
MKRFLLFLSLASAGAQSLPIRPDAKLTPGAIATLNTGKVCTRGYSDTVRRTSAAMKARVFKAYGLTNTPGPDFEVDHRVPLSLGGADVERNLWPQSYFTTPWNAHVKDKLEYYIWRRVCIQKTMTLLEGQRLFEGDWIRAYTDYLGKP